MGRVKAVITVVGSRQAKIGFTFLHEGSLKTCEKCPYRKVCIDSLERGEVYKVVKLRSRSLPCVLREEDAKVVEVEKAEIDGALESRLVFPGGIITLNHQICDTADCENRHLCQPNLLEEGTKVKIVEVKGPLRCPSSHSLVHVSLLKA